jgi:hypothetical protein
MSATAPNQKVGSQQPALEALWRCQRIADFSLRTWPDGCVVFDDATAQLQCLSPVAGELLTLLMQRAQWTATDLAQTLLGEMPTADDVEMVENQLTAFFSLHFIDRVAV